MDINIVMRRKTIRPTDRIQLPSVRPIFPPASTVSARINVTEPQEAIKIPPPEKADLLKVRPSVNTNLPSPAQKLRTHPDHLWKPGPAPIARS